MTEQTPKSSEQRLHDIIKRAADDTLEATRTNPVTDTFLALNAARLAVQYLLEELLLAKSEEITGIGAHGDISHQGNFAPTSGADLWMAQGHSPEEIAVTGQELGLEDEVIATRIGE
ncbi:MAG: hypothetical protein JWS12_822 [Candidatus Saccharibacteria bacterium]|nr:hypothetical protein [Candidatus Saccharibacteria bacterium]